jgi:hypothetical protein
VMPRDDGGLTTETVGLILIQIYTYTQCVHFLVCLNTITSIHTKQQIQIQFSCSNSVDYNKERLSDMHLQHTVNTD